MNRRHFLHRTGLTTAGLLTANIAMAEETPISMREALPIGLAKARKPLPDGGELLVKRPEEVRILQLTDIHLFGDHSKNESKRDQQTLEDIPRLVDLADPDFIAFTGDLWHDNPDGRGLEFFHFALEKITSLGRPWLFTWGNHDLLDEYEDAQVALTEAPMSLYRGGMSAGNYRLQLVDAEKTPLWDLVCLNTTSCGVQEPQEKWLSSLAPTVTKGAFCFLHIPLLQYDVVWNREMAQGVRQEAVCTYGEDGSGLGYLKRLGGVKACFCGHDHVNDYAGVIEGIDMVYGRATGYASYGGDKLRKGGKLITLNALEGTYRWKSIFADGTEWLPEA